MANIVLLDLMGGVALLLWGLHMVHSGIVRAFGSDLRALLALALKNRVLAAAAGMAVTALLQSSTATGLITASFAARGFVTLVTGLAIMLGANVGTALIVQALSFNVTAAAPVFLLVGLVAFRRGGRTRTRDLGRVAIGLGLMLISLHILLNTLAPAEEAPAVRSLLAAVTGEPVICVLIAAALTWAAHSSVAVVLLVASLAYSGFVTPTAALALVLGANLGAALNPVIEGSQAARPASRRLPLGNLINRVLGLAVALPLLPQIVELIGQFEPNRARFAADFHLLFNLATGLVFLPLLGPLARLLERLFPEQAQTTDPTAPLYLDDSLIETPTVALTAAARETLHMGDLVEAMFRESWTALMTGDRKLVGRVSKQDNTIDRLHEAVKLYVVKITRQSLDEAEARRAMEIVSFAINLEHIGDIIDKNLMELAAKKIKNRYSFSDEGAAELSTMAQSILDNMKLAFGVFLSGDAKVARRLLVEKTRLRDMELTVAERHLDRLRQGRPESIETTSLHLDILRDLKRIHSHICSVAYPVLEATGELGTSRLRQPAPTSDEAVSDTGVADAASAGRPG